MRPTAMIAVQPEVRTLDAGLLVKVFYVFVLLALLSVGISIGGKWLGRSIVMAGHTDDRTLHEIVIGNNVVTAAANEIRFERSRRDGVTKRLDLYLRWPELEGYSELTRDDFNHAGGIRRIIFVSLEERQLSRDMSGRFEPIYSAMIERPGEQGPAGIVSYRFDKKSGYLNEMLEVAERPGKEPFVARCISGPSAEESLAPCQRDIHLGDNLSLSYRFPAELLGNWKELDASIQAKAARLLATGR